MEELCMRVKPSHLFEREGFLFLTQPSLLLANSASKASATGAGEEMNIGKKLLGFIENYYYLCDK